MTNLKNLTYNSTEFTFIPDTLKVRKLGIPILIQFEKLNAKYLKDVDLKALAQYQKNEIHLTNAKNEALKRLTVQQNAETKNLKAEEELEKEIQTYDTALNKNLEAMTLDPECKIIIALKTKIEALVIAELLYDTPLMKEFIARAVQGQTNIIDYNTEDGMKFCSDVLTHFFTLARTKLAESKPLK